VHFHNGTNTKRSHASSFTKQTYSSRRYFRYLLSLLTTDHLLPAMAQTAKSDPARWMDELLAGFVTSADTGNEDLVIASRAALADYCARSPAHRDRVCAALARNLRARQGEDRTIVPTLEVVAYLFYAGVYARTRAVDFRALCLQVQKAGYKTGNVRKLEACVRVYAAVAGMPALDTAAEVEQEEFGVGTVPAKREEAVREARKRLGALMSHPWPRIRSLVVDELWGLLAVADEDGAEAAERLKGVDWGAADKGQVKGLVEALCLG
jgi:tubulin-specific chaperone D